MNIEEFFKSVGGDYEEVITRLPSDEMIKKFVRKFPGDPSFNSLEKAFEENDVKAAFLAAHTLKGTAANLGLNSLSNAASTLTELLRDASALPEKSDFETVKSEYENAIEKISLLD